MKQLEPTTTITIGDEVYEVSTLPESIQNKVTVYDSIRADYEKARIELIKCDAAMREFGNQIARDIQDNLTKEQSVENVDAGDK